MRYRNNPDAPGVSGIRGLLLSVFILITIVAMVNVGTTNTVALDPHVFTGTVYEANGTACNNCTVTVLNVRTQESANTTSNATGIYAYNLLNLPRGWAYGDTIQITATNATNSTGTNSTQILIGTTSTDMDIWIGTQTEVSGVSFYVIDEDGYPVESALINIKDSSGDIVTTKMTDSDGKASHTLSDALYTLTVSKSGYDDEVVLARVHGTTAYTIRLGDEAVGITITDWTYWAMFILACIGIIAVLMFVFKVR